MPNMITDEGAQLFAELADRAQLFADQGPDHPAMQNTRSEHTPGADPALQCETPEQPGPKTPAMQIDQAAELAGMGTYGIEVSFFVEYADRGARGGRRRHDYELRAQAYAANPAAAAFAGETAAQHAIPGADLYGFKRIIVITPEGDRLWLPPRHDHVDPWAGPQLADQADQAAELAAIAD